MAGGLMQIELSYKLQVMRRRPVSVGNFVGSLAEQELEIQSRDLRRSSPKLMSIQLNDTIKEMFDTAQPEDKFDCQIVVKCDYPGLPIPSYEKSYPDTPYVFEPKSQAAAR
jgi:hypothetical protein